MAQSSIHSFNPRTPRGVRLCAASCHPPMPSFQSTHPSRGATAVSVSIRRRALFQSTHPSRGATSGMVFFTVTSSVSIHAPLAGCDHQRMAGHTSLRGFNPRTPRGVRLDYKALREDLRKVSIHTPLAGCDPDGKDFSSRIWEFQSTHPSRGATSTTENSMTSGFRFNPRTPRGVRQ